MKMKLIVALFALLATGQALAWTRIVNNTSYPIKFRAALKGGDIFGGKKYPGVASIPTIAPHTELFTNEGLANLRTRYDIFVNYGDDNFVQVVSKPVGNEGGNRQLDVYRDDDGNWRISSLVRGAN